MKALLPLLAPALFAISLAQTPFAQAEGPQCDSLFASIDAPARAPAALNERVYPVGIDPNVMPGGFMQIGYESEYLFSESAAILRDYAPAADVMPVAQWNAKTDEERLAWLKEKFQNKPEFAAATGLFKQVDTPYMPQELIVDSTGNVEIVLAPFDSYGDWAKAVDEIVARYGVGSQQAMISKPREAAFTLADPLGFDKMIDKSLGWFVYTNLRDMFAKLQSGAARYKKDNTKLTAQFMDHPFLGPMTFAKRTTMEVYLRANANGQMYDDGSKQYVRKRDASFKYTGGPSYRPDVAGPGRFSWEIRNAHKDVADLKMKVQRDLYAHSHTLEPYETFADVPAFDSVGLFQRFDAETQAALQELFPSKADPRFAYQMDDRVALESFRNFALPLQDFTHLAKALALNADQEQSILKQVGIARLTYITGVHQVAEKLRLGQITREQAKADVMGLVCIWSVDSGLAPAFDLRAKAIGHEPSAAQVAPAAAVAPLAKAG